MDLERNIKPWMLYSGICERTITTLRTKWTFHSNSLDLSKAFDTINQDPLLKRLKCNSIRDLALYQLSPKLIDDIAFSREFQFFMIFFFVLVNMGEKKFKTLLLQITARIFKLVLIFFSMVVTKLHLGSSKFGKLKF